MNLISNYNKDDILGAIKAKGMSLTDIANELSVSVEMVRHVISGKRRSQRINNYLYDLILPRLTLLDNYRQLEYHSSQELGHQAVNL
jgi:orotate phosphoribosyltransferase-like protein